MASGQTVVMSVRSMAVAVACVGRGDLCQCVFAIVVRFEDINLKFRKFVKVRDVIGVIGRCAGL